MSKHYVRMQKMWGLKESLESQDRCIASVDRNVGLAPLKVKPMGMCRSKHAEPEHTSQGKTPKICGSVR